MPGNADRIQYLIKDWLEENQIGSAEEIAAGIGSPYPTVARNIKLLFAKGEIEKSQKNAERYIKWVLTGHASKMPLFKYEQDYVTALSVFQMYVKAARGNSRLDDSVRGQVMRGVCWTFAAAIFAATDGSSTAARQSLTMARQEMIKALNRAETQLDFVRAVVREPRLNVTNPRELIDTLLQDETNPIDFAELRNDVQFLMMLHNEASG